MNNLTEFGIYILLGSITATIINVPDNFFIGYFLGLILMKLIEIGNKTK